MPSHLTRQVFRRLLAGEPIVHRGCLRRRPYSSLARDMRCSRPATNLNRKIMMGYEQRRTFLNFNFFQRNEKAEKEADMDPGLEKMMELAKRERMRARMPPIEEVENALYLFFNAKWRNRASITDNQAQLAAQSLQYYLSKLDELESREPAERAESTPRPPEEGQSYRLGMMAYKKAATVLRRLPAQPDESYVRLAKLLCDAAAKLEGAQNVKDKALITYIHTLAAVGQSQQAKVLLEEFERTSRTTGVTTAEAESMETQAVEDEAELDGLSSGEVEHDESSGPVAASWVFIFEGFVREGNDAEAQRVLALIQDRGIKSRGRAPLVMVQSCLRRRDLPGVRKWWDEYRHACLEEGFAQPPKAAEVLKEILMWCLEHKELEFGHAIVKDLMNPNPPKELWDAVFVWAAGTGKGVDEIDRMIGVMEKSNDAIPDEADHRLADIQTINTLVEFAVQRKDPYMAERFISLGQKRDIQPNARTYVLQMQYRLSVDDVDGALIAYKSMQTMDLSSNDDLPTVNALIVALCNSHRHDFDTIMNVAADLSDRRTTFDAATVAALALLHLNRDEHTDVLDLLNTHAYHYSSASRNLIRDALLSTSLNPSTPTARAWNAYLIIHDLFDETPRPQRTELMTSFMSRNRADMGVRVFQHMRAHSRKDIIPTVDTYVAAFLGLAKIRELESLEVVHNQLKLDFNVLPTTYCYNALMLAYIACGDAEAGLKFWANIVASKEGPSYNSIHIALRACEKTAFGDLKAREIWSLLRRRNVDLDHNLWCSYLAALCGNGNVDQALNAAEEAEERGEVVVDEFLLGCLCDAIPKYQEKQDMVEEWAMDRYPQVWKRLLEEVGFEEVEGVGRRFKVDRRVAP